MDYASADMERMLIKGLLSGGTLHVSLTGSDFSYYADLFNVITALKESRKSVNFATVSAKLSDTTMLMECIDTDGRAAMVDDYANTIRDLAKRRNAVEIIRSAEAALDDPMNETANVVDNMRDALLGISGTDSFGWTDSKTVLTATTEHIKKVQSGEVSSISTGIQAVDNKIGGFFCGEMTIIGARPGVGKSAFALHIAYDAAKKHKSVGIVSREMTDTQLGQRLLAKASRVNGMHIRKGELTDDEWFDITTAGEILSEMDISFLFGVKDVEDLRRMVQSRAEIAPLDILIVDYLQLMDTTQKKSQEHLRVGTISKALKDISVDYNIPVIALAQVNRDTDGMMPTLRNLKDSGSIEQDADNIIFLHRVESSEDPNAHPDDRASIEGWKQRGFDYIVVNIAKQRQGEIGKAGILFDKSHMDYISLQ